MWIPTENIYYYIAVAQRPSHLHGPVEVRQFQTHYPLALGIHTRFAETHFPSASFTFLPQLPLLPPNRAATMLLLAGGVASGLELGLLTLNSTADPRPRLNELASSDQACPCGKRA